MQKSERTTFFLYAFFAFTFYISHGAYDALFCVIQMAGEA
jgi:hypothetical protein